MIASYWGCKECFSIAVFDYFLYVDIAKVGGDYELYLRKF